MKQFVTEVLTLGLFGGLVGTAVGIGGSLAVDGRELGGQEMTMLQVDGFGSKMPGRLELVSRVPGGEFDCRLLSAVAHGHSWSLTGVGFKPSGKQNMAIKVQNLSSWFTSARAPSSSSPERYGRRYTCMAGRAVRLPVCWRRLTTQSVWSPNGDSGDLKR